MFACLFCDGNPVRLTVLRRAYLLAALIAAAAGYIGYFHLLPGSSIFLDLTNSARIVGARQRHVQGSERVRAVPDISAAAC